MDDSFLIKGLVAGEEKAYEILFERHYRILCLYASKFVKNSDVAENLVCEVISGMWEKKSDIQITSSLRNYLIQSVKNRCYNYLKEEQRRRGLLEEYYKEHLDSLCNQYDNNYPSSALLIKELDLKIKKSVKKLPQTTREIFVLSRVSKFTYKEIAEKLNLSVDSVKYHIKSALAKLREELL